MPGKLTAALAAACGAALLVAVGGNAAPPQSVTCSKKTGAFSGAAHDLTVAAGATCEVTYATITNDLIVQPGGSLFIAYTTVGRDLVAQKPHTIQTNGAGPGRPVGPVHVSRNFTVSG